MRAALEAARGGSRVVLAVKGRTARSGVTPMAGADIMVDSRTACEMGFKGDPADSPEQFAEDIITEGLYLNNQKLVEVYVRDAPERVRELLGWGLKVHTFTRAHGERYPRGIITPGIEIANALRRGLREKKVQVIEDFMATDLLTSRGRVVGAVGLDLRRGRFLVVSAKAVVLATGGWPQLYPFTSCSDDLTGDGQAMAFRAGAELVDAEMVQFCPNVLIWPPIRRGSIFIYVIPRTVSGHLLNSAGVRFMHRWDPVHLENSTKEIVSLGSFYEIQQGRGTPHGGVYFSAKHLPHEVADRLSTRTRDGKWQGDDFSSLIERLREGHAVEVGPAAHFFIGGIAIDESCATSLPGLFAAGECAGNLWGANRIAAATTQIVVQGAVAGKSAARFAAEVEEVPMDQARVSALEAKVFGPFERAKGPSPIDLRRELRELAWKHVGVIRNGAGLEQALCRTQELRTGEVPALSLRTKNRRYNREWIDALQVENLATMLEVSARSALHRTESRGSHYRSDHPQMDNDRWLRNIFIRGAEGDGLALEERPVVVTRLEPPQGKMSYEDAVKMTVMSLE